MDAIISRSNEKVKYIKNLNEKKFRQKHNCFYIEGIKVVQELLESYKAIDILFIAYSKELLMSANGGSECLEKVNKFCKKTNMQLIELDKKLFEYVTDTVSPQGILVVVRTSICDIDSLLEENKDENILVLDKIQDAGNIGTIIRNADAFGLRLIFCTNGTTDIYSPKVVRSTMGSIFRVNIVYIDDDDLDLIMYKIKENGQKIAITQIKDALSVEDVDYSKRYAFILGNEANGVSQRLAKLSDIHIKIPMSSTVQSLNVSIAGGILLYKQYISRK
ncbi:MAG: RNA methyltransferase [Clostridia bacterium]